RIYHISLILEIFYFAMVAYTPIYLRNLGMEWDSIGIIFSIMLIPFVALEYPAGLVADRWLGEKELLVVAIIILGVSTNAISLTRSTQVITWAGLLLITRVGAALIEILRDSYFYKRIDGQEIEIINFFRTARPVGFLVGAFITYIWLTVFSLSSVFSVLAIIIFTAIISAAFLQDNRSEKELKSQPSSSQG
ncbi:MFS transporter, partial [Candidatus Parcubacteria bacterium]